MRDKMVNDLIQVTNDFSLSTTDVVDSYVGATTIPYASWCEWRQVVCVVID